MTGRFASPLPGTGRLRSLVIACAALATLPALAPAARADDAAPTGSAPAEEKPSIFTVIAAPGDRFGQRVLDELSSLGFQAVRVDPPDEPVSRVSLEAAARQAGALAAIRALPSERGVEVWIADRVTGKTVLREIPIDPGVPDPESALAIRAVELLRASLLEASLPVPPPGEVPATPAVREKLVVPAPAAPKAPGDRAPPPLRLRISLSPGVLVSPGGFDPAAALDVGIAWIPTDHAGLSAFASIPLSRPGVQSAAGGAALATVLAGGGIRFVFTARSSTWDPSLDMGVTAISLQVSGSANAGYSARDAAAWTAAPFVRAGIAFAGSSMLRLRADVLATGIFQGATIQLAGEEAAEFGEPIVILSAGIDFGWL